MTQVKGFQQKTQGDGMFFAIKHGSIVRTSKTPQDGFEKVEGENHRTKEKYTSYIQRYDTLEAFVTKIEWYDTEQKFTTRYKGFKLYLDANGKKGVLDLPIQARATGRFMKLAENVDYTRPVEFRAWHDSKNDSTAFFVGQRVSESDEKSASVPQKYTRENPGDMPEPTQSQSTGKWNYDNQTDFLHKRMMEVVIPKVAAAHPDKQKGEDDEPAERTASKDTYQGGVDGAGEPPSNGKLDPKMIERVKAALVDLSEDEKYQDRTRTQLMDEFFGTSKFSEIESLPPEQIKAVLKKIDEILVPF